MFRKFDKQSVPVCGGFAAACGVVLMVQAAVAGWNPETRTYDHTGYISLKAGVREGGTTGSFNTGANWEDGKAPEPGKSYYVPASSSLRMLLSCTTPFAGDVLAMAGASSWQGATASIPVCHLLSGASFTFYNSVEAFTNGVWTLYPTDPTKSVTLSWGVNTGTQPYSSGARLMDMTIKGDADTQLDFENGSIFPWAALYLTAPNDFKEFYGTLRFKVKTPETQYTKFIPAKDEPFDFPGTFSMCANSIIDASDATDIAAAPLTVGNLLLETNVTLNVAASLASEAVRTLTVTGTYAHVGPLTVSMPTSVDLGSLTDTFAARTLVPFRQKVPDGAGADPLFALDDFRLEGAVQSYGLPTWSYSVKRMDGYDSLCCSNKLIVLKTSAGDPSSTSSLTNINAWSDQKLPHPGADYLTFSEIRLPTCVNPNPVGGDKYLWPFEGDSLVLGSIGGKNGSLSMTTPTKRFSVGKLALAENTTVVSYSTAGQYIAPKIETFRSISTVHNQYVTLRVYMGSSITLDGEISGDTGFLCQYRGNNFAGGWIALPGANTNLTGKILMACQFYNISPSSDNYKQYTPRETNRVEVVVADGRNLGGALPEFAYDALRIRDWSLLNVTNTTEFAEPTRGVFVDGIACIGVADGKTAAFRAPFTFGGVLKKQGAGTLALAGTAPKFATGTTDNYTVGDTPVAGTNVVLIAEGAIKPLSSTAFDGLELRFAAGSRLKVDVDPQDADLRARGLVNTKWAAPFVAPTDGTIAVELDCPAGSALESYEFAICTVRKADVPDPRALFSVVRPRIGGHRYVVTTNVRDNGDGTQTLVARAVRAGLVLVFR